MLPATFPVGMRIRGRYIAASLILMMNAFVWYLFVFGIITSVTRSAELTSVEQFAVWGVNFVSAAVSALLGAIFTSRFGKRDLFLSSWMLFGVVSSIIPMFLQVSDRSSLFFTVFLFGAAFGIGMPSAMSYFSDSTTVQNRATVGGMVFLAMGLGAFALGMFPFAEVSNGLVIAAVWRCLGAAAFVLAKPPKTDDKGNRPVSYKTVLANRSFLLYFIPWAMFCLVNEASTPIILRYFGEEFTNLSTAIEFALTGISALVSGVVCDRIGRRRVAIAGFVMLGVGYAILGLFPQAVFSRYFYTVADGVAWGIFFAIFFITIWGDIAGEAKSEKFYAIGGLPYLLSNFLRYVLGPLIADAVAIYAIFSLASFFLFLAVLPLMYAPETLPERHIKDRELKIYVAKAKRVRQKYT